ncbi:hypothetical protein CASFOL_001923 [Castilleja foliolosa]|uniref:DUF630 domain-containing protein n=1 Tax=Castilleja foliolosa TaxID=1961234 RepID=A0ABD3ED76_9LAMI
MGNEKRFNIIPSQLHRVPPNPPPPPPPPITTLSSGLLYSASPLSALLRYFTAVGDSAASSESRAQVLKPCSLSARALRRCEAASFGSSEMARSASVTARSAKVRLSGVDLAFNCLVPEQFHTAIDIKLHTPPRSKADHLPLVVKCRERRDLIRAAANYRYALAAAHISYFRSLNNYRLRPPMPNLEVVVRRPLTTCNRRRMSSL